MDMKIPQYLSLYMKKMAQLRYGKVLSRDTFEMDSFCENVHLLLGFFSSEPRK